LGSLQQRVGSNTGPRRHERSDVHRLPEVPLGVGNAPRQHQQPEDRAMNKAILAVMVLQTGLIVLLLTGGGLAGLRSDQSVRVLRPEARMEDLAVHCAHDSLSAVSPLAEEWFRRVFREELADRFDRILLERETAMTPETIPPAGQHTTLAIDEPFTADPYQVEYVSQQIDYFVSVGTITSTEMTRLQSDIARLTGMERQRLLQRLVAALNSGQLKGRL
jgi:hypothetical protein